MTSIENRFALRAKIAALRTQIAALTEELKDESPEAAADAAGSASALFAAWSKLRNIDGTNVPSDYYTSRSEPLLDRG